jgi:DNA-binding LacI/PurR family transcriptional regulator
MTDYNITLNQIAKSVGVNPAILESYLLNTLDHMKRSTFIEPKITQIEQKLSEGGAGVFYCLLIPSNRKATRPRTIDNFMSQLLEGIYQSAVEHGCELIYMVNHATLATEDYFRSVLEKYQNAGVLMLVPQRADALAKICEEMDRHCLIIDYQNPLNRRIHSLNIDNFGAIFEMTRMLTDLGHRRIAFITGILDFDSAAQRYEGYQAALESEGIPFDEALIKYGDWQMEAANQMTQELLRLPDPPTAIVCSNDLSALGAYGAIKSTGLSIPTDISVTGFDDIPIVANIDPPLTTIRQSLPEMGQEAADILIEAMEGRLADNFQHEHSVEFKLRQSIGPARQ